MSDPRMIPADEARRLREAATPGPWYVMDNSFGEREILGTSPDRPGVFPILGELQEEEDADLARLAPDLACTVERQAAQIERVREVLAWTEQAENRAHTDWTRTAETHHRDAALAYTQAATWLRYALGDNDE